MTTKTPIIIRPVELQELTYLQHIGKTTFLEAFASENNPDDMAAYIDKSFSEEQLKRELTHQDSQFFFAELDGEIVGYIKLNWGEAQTEQKLVDALEIERIYVLSSHYGKGIGQLLYTKAIDFAYGQGFKRVWLGVWEGNTRALKFYRKNGFQTFDTHIFVLGEDRQTDLLMKQELED